VCFPNSTDGNGCEQSGPYFPGDADSCCQLNYGNPNMQALPAGTQTLDGLDVFTCISSICGNGQCEIGENSSNCSADCGGSAGGGGPPALDNEPN
ncbi:MAG: hypothetical protein QGI45_08995, partial [Myxococcota bacterium]|nr:hypothetical protein [Myxococcota bacterium]